MASINSTPLQAILGCIVVAAGLLGASTVVSSFADSTAEQATRREHRDAVARQTWEQYAGTMPEVDRGAMLPRPIWEDELPTIPPNNGRPIEPPPVEEGFEIVVAPRADGELEMPPGFSDPNSILFGRWLLWSLLRPPISAKDMLPEFNQMMMSQMELYDVPFTVEEAIEEEARRAYDRIARRVVVLLHRVEFRRARDFVGHCMSAMDPTLFPDEALTERNISFRRAWRLYDELAALVRDYAAVQAGEELPGRDRRDNRRNNDDNQRDGDRRER